MMRKLSEINGGPGGSKFATSFTCPDPDCIQYILGNGFGVIRTYRPVGVAAEPPLPEFDDVPTPEL
jgi:hypothetical protein